MPRRAKLKDVAALAQTSTATASRAINGRGYVSSELRARVDDAMQTLNYRPNLRAKGLRERASHSIGLVIPNLNNAYYAALTEAIVQLLSRRGYHVLVSSTGDDANNEQETVYDMVNQDVEGVIWVPSTPHSRLVQYLQKQGVPAVAVVRRVAGDVLDTVVFEDYKASYAAMQHLMSLGHQRIGYIGGDVSHSSNHARWQGSLAALRDSGLPLDESLYRLGPLRAMWGRVAAADLMRLPQPPTALFVASNALVGGVVTLLRQNGTKVPGEVSLLCFDDIDWFSLMEPPITAVGVSHTRLAEAAVDLVIQRIENPNAMAAASALMEISFELLVRGSTGPAPARR